MRAGLPRDTGELAGRAFLVAAAVLIALALFEGGGSTYGPLVGVGGAAVAVAAAALALALFGVIPWPPLERTELACLGLLAGLVVWIGLSVLWSVTPDRSWEYFNRGVVYLAFALIGLFIAATVRAALRAVAAGLTVLLSAVIVWALAGKVVPALFPDGERIARLRDPIDYWNGLALVAATALPLGLSFAVRREHPQPVRTAAVVLLFAATVTLLLTYSRGGVVVALLVIAAYLAVSRQRVEAVAAMLIALPPAIVVSAWAFTQPGSRPTSSRRASARRTAFSSGSCSSSRAPPSPQPRTTPWSGRSAGVPAFAGACQAHGWRAARSLPCSSPCSPCPGATRSTGRATVSASSRTL